VSAPSSMELFAATRQAERLEEARRARLGRAGTGRGGALRRRAGTGRGGRREVQRRCALALIGLGLQLLARTG